MSHASRPVAALAAVSCTLAPAVAGGTATFEVIPVGPELGSFFVPHTMTPDARVIVGMTGAPGTDFQAGMWVRGAGLTGLGDLPGGSVQSRAWGVSADGRVVVGEGWNGKVSRAFRWTAETGMVELPMLDGFGDGATSEALDISADGSLIVGFCGNLFGGPLYETRWTADATAGVQRYEADGVSANGTILAGSGTKSFESVPWIWTIGVGDPMFLPQLPRQSYSKALGISDDGTTLFGEATLTIAGEDHYTSWAWRSGMGMRDFGQIEALKPGTPFPKSITADGGIVVGTHSCACPEYAHAFIWDEAHGIRDFQEVLRTEYGLDISAMGLTLIWASAISADGSWIAGEALDESGNYPGYLVHLSEGCRADCNGDGQLDINDFICFQAEWRTRTAYGDFNGDGLFNINDFVAFQAAWQDGTTHGCG